MLFCLREIPNEPGLAVSSRSHEDGFGARTALRPASLVIARHVLGELFRDRPQLREALIPSSAFEILDTWHVSGLRGSGSHDVAAHDAFVPDEHVTAVMQGGMQLRETGTLYRYPPFNRLAYNKIGVATGIAQAAL